MFGPCYGFLLPLFVGVLCLVLVMVFYSHCLLGCCVWPLLWFLFSTLCPSSFVIILMGKTELDALLNCLPNVLGQSVLYGSSSRSRRLVCCVLVIFPDHTHLLLYGL